MSETREITLEERIDACSRMIEALPSIAEYKRVVKQREALKKALVRLMKAGRLANGDDYKLARVALRLVEDEE